MAGAGVTSAITPHRERTGQPMPTPCPLHTQGFDSQGTEKWLDVDQKALVLNTSQFEATVGW